MPSIHDKEKLNHAAPAVWAIYSHLYLPMFLILVTVELKYTFGARKSSHEFIGSGLKSVKTQQPQRWYETKLSFI
jgi:hypothetical protein